jgi:hypothetical protein
VKNPGKGSVGAIAVAACEVLEQRQLLAAPPPVELRTDGCLVVTGTSSADKISVGRLTGSAFDQLRVSMGKRRSYFNTADVVRIDVDAGGGNDRVDLAADTQPLTIPFRVNGGKGNDTLNGGHGDDYLLGGAGNDSISGGIGNDVVEGAEGNDSIFGGKGDDALYGNAGNDLLSDDRGDNTLDGGKGKNTLKRGLVGPEQFVIGVWGQRSGLAWKWRARGVNTMVAAETMGGAVTITHWDEEVTRNGMNVIRQPSGDLDYDLSRPNVLAWLAPDEPDVHHTDPRQVIAFYEKMKMADPEKPVFLNFSGGHVVGYQDRGWKHPYAQWVQGGDWISNDIYPVAGWNLPRRLGLVGHAVDILTGYAPDKPQFAFIETSDQGLAWNLNAPGPNPAQVRAEIWNAVIHGVKGIVYFSDQFKPKFEYDATPPDVVAEITAQNARLTDLSPVLLSKNNPKGYGIELPPGFEASWRAYKGKTYFIVLNTGSRRVDDVKMTLHGVADGPAEVRGEGRTEQISGGQITDTFEGYSAHVYVVGG